ncbi:BnaA06g25100D [Brassica napus]|uniref:BnaA06g25100D protein n=1 Tax=Brassica napus TaxID=3708 RepID=A0A078GVT3_BRANA|nr:BnaA06g25100D [Brassica napus]
MSVDEKRKLVHELSKDSDLAFEALQVWTHEEIRQVLCAELGKERKYKNLTKAQLINSLLRTRDSSTTTTTKTTKRNSKRQRKNATPTRYVSAESVNKAKGGIYCKNLACQAVLRQEDLFCQRCSCCVCHKYDDNKDPSLWLTCGSDPPFPGESCGLSCHLDCAFKNEKSGLKPSSDVDGCFYCVSCGKTNSLLECWKKQLLIAKETRSVDVLCNRLVLAQKLLKGTEKYRKLSETVEEAVKSLETELCGGPLTDLPSAMCRGNVNRLGSAPKVKDLCSSALKSLQDTPDVDETKVSTRTLQEEEEETVSEKVVNGKSSTSCGFGLEDCVKIMRQLECSGYVDKSFRQEFLTWYSLRASAQEMNVVKTFIDAFGDDSVALAEQLVDTFSDCISRKR